MKVQQPLSKQTLMKSNAQLRRDDFDDDMPAAMPVAFPDVASSSHTIPPSEPEANYSQIIEALAAIQLIGAVYQQTGGANPFGPSGVPSSPSPC
jgi:hypothetical protein